MNRNRYLIRIGIDSIKDGETTMTVGYGIEVSQEYFHSFECEDGHNILNNIDDCSRVLLGNLIKHDNEFQCELLKNPIKGNLCGSFYAIKLTLQTRSLILQTRSDDKTKSDDNGKSLHNNSSNVHDMSKMFEISKDYYCNKTDGHHCVRDNIEVCLNMLRGNVCYYDRDFQFNGIRKES